MSRLTMYLMGTTFIAGGIAMTMYKLSILNIWTSFGVAIIIGLGIKLAWSQPRRKGNPDTVKRTTKTRQ
jgi:hypothetical protein